MKIRNNELYLFGRLFPQRVGHFLPDLVAVFHQQRQRDPMVKVPVAPVVACKDMKSGEQTKLNTQETIDRIKAGLAELEKGSVIVE